MLHFQKSNNQIAHMIQYKSAPSPIAKAVGEIPI
jgi:hypothetical protein